MFKGQATCDVYEKCLSVGLCQAHLEELSEDINVTDPQELQRKALLYIRLRILDPLLFGKPFVFEKMKALVSRSGFFKRDKTADKLSSQNSWEDSILLLDSIVVFTLCHFCKVCCSGCLFMTSQRSKSSHLEADFIYNLLNSKSISEKDIGHFNPLLQENFKGYEAGFIKFCYVVALLCVRNMTIRTRLNQALSELSVELQNISKESEKWLEIGDDAYKKQNTEEAIEAYTSALKYNPYCVSGLSQRAQVYFKIENFKLAQLDSYVALMIDPQCCSAYIVLSSSLTKQDAISFSHKVVQYGLSKCKQVDSEEYKKLVEIEKTALSGDVKDKSLNKETALSDIVDFENEDPKVKDPPDHEGPDSGTEDVPELSDASSKSAASDSEEEDQSLGKLKENTSQSSMHIKEEKSEVSFTKYDKKKSASGKRSRKNSTTLIEEKGNKCKELFSSLKEASQTLLDGCGPLAIRHFDVALRIIKDFPDIYNFKEWEFVSIKYAYGFAYCTAGGFEDLQKSIAIFKEIINNYKDVSFPAVYYAIGLSFYKLNRFKDALEYLRIVDDILRKGIRFKVYAWPGLSSVINETKSDKLKCLVEDLIKDCEAPPPPDAVCRLNECTFQPMIYFSDPDFKGFYCLQCSDHCSLQYHPHCFKILKNNKQFTDKEFLGQNCLTPDCDGTIIKVESISKEGNVEKVFGSTQAKKVTKQKKNRFLKKIDLKEEKKKKRQNSRDIETDKNRGLLETSPTSSNELNESAGNYFGANENCNLKLVSETVPNSLTTKANEPAKDNILPSVHGEPYIIFKKEKIYPETSNKNMPIVKELKKIKDHVFSFEEFHKESKTYSNECREPILTPQKNQCIIQDEWPTCNQMNEHPVLSSCIVNNEPHVSNCNSFAGDEENVFDEISDLEAIKSNLYNYMEDFLNRTGPLSVKDSRLIDELETFPTEANIVIAKCGGIANFLKDDNKYRFGIVDAFFICSRNDLADAYKLSRSSGIIGSDNQDLLEEFKTTNSENQLCNGIETSLNPEAKEYTPSSNSSSSYNSITSFTEEFYGDHKKEMSQQCSTSLITAISKLREPISVDKHNFRNDNRKINSVDISHGKNSAKLIPQSSRERFHDKELINNTNFNLSEKCIEGVKLYFKEEMTAQRAYIDSCIKPYGVVCISDKIDKCLQTEDVQFANELNVRNIEELSKLKDIINTLTREKKDLLVQKTLAETKLESELDSSIRCKKQAAIEIENLKRDLEEASQNLESLKKDSKNKQLTMEKEHSLLMESFKKTAEENVKLTKEVTSLQTEMESMLETFKKCEETVLRVENENDLLEKTLEEQYLKQSEIVKNLVCEKLQLTKKAQDANLQFLKMKKELIFHKIDSKSNEATQNLKSVSNFLQSPLSTSIPLFKNSLEALMDQISKCIRKLAEIRLDFQSRIDEQINAVNNNIPLETLASIEVNDLPEIPTLENILKPSNPGNVQNTVYNDQMINLWNSACNFPSNNSIGPNSGVYLSNPSIPMPSQTMSFPQNQKILDNTTKENVQSSKSGITKTKPPPGINNLTVSTSASNDCQGKNEKCKTFSAPSVSNSAPLANSSAMSNQFSAACSSQTKDIKNIITAANKDPENSFVQATSQTSLSSSSSTTDNVDRSNNGDIASLELGYKAKQELLERSSLPSVPIKAKGTYEKLLQKLKSRYPNYGEGDLMQYIKQFRESRKGGLSGLTIDNIITNVSSIIESSKPSVESKKPPVESSKPSVESKKPPVESSKPSVESSKPSVESKKPAVEANKPPVHIEKTGASNINIAKPAKVLKNKKITLDSKQEKPQKLPAQKPCPWARSDSECKTNWTGNNTLVEECIICYSEMTVSTAYKVDCGHFFHLDCIRQWLNKKSDCPICRMHLLLPEDYPALS